MLKKIIENTKIIIIIPIIILLLLSLFLTVYGVYEFYELIHHFIVSPADNKSALIAAKVLGIIDVFILVIILYILSVGFYELFIGDIKLPEWLEIKSLDQLKAKLASVVIMFLAIFFTQQLVIIELNINLLYLGISVSLVMAVLVVYYKIKSNHD